MTRRLAFWIVLVVTVIATACDYNLRVETPITPTSIPTSTTNQNAVTVEFRVDGDVSSAVVRVSNALDGLSQITTVLPYTSSITVTNRDSMFLSADARGAGFGFLHVAIFVNGILFREGSASAFNPFVTVNGTYRR